MLSAGARKAYLNREEAYLSIVKDIRAFEAALRAKVATSGGSYEQRQRAADALSKIRALDFGAFDGDYGGVELKAGYAAFLHMASVFQDKEWYLRKLAEIRGKLWVLDHTFKIAGKIMDRKGAQAFAAACDVMNELKQFAAIAFLKDTRIASLRNLFAMLYERTDADAPEYISTDLCCLADKEILEFFGKAKVEADGGVGGITQTHLGGWHAVTRVTSKVTNKRIPSRRTFLENFGERPRSLRRRTSSRSRDVSS